MTSAELDKVFLLLRQFYSQHPFWENKNQQLAYRMALEPYAYEDVKASVLNIVRQTKFFPYLSEITDGLVIKSDGIPPTPPESNAEMNAKFDREVREKYGSWAAYREKLAEWIAELEAK